VRPGEPDLGVLGVLGELDHQAVGHAGEEGDPAADLPGLMVQPAEAQAGPQKSLILLHTGGALGEHWAAPGDLTLGAMSAPYEPVKADMNFIVNGKMAGGGHGIMFHRYNDGSFNKDSFDVNLGRTIGANRPVKFLPILPIRSTRGRTGSTYPMTIFTRSGRLPTSSA
jgi:hypothetical protein